MKRSLIIGVVVSILAGYAGAKIVEGILQDAGGMSVIKAKVRKSASTLLTEEVKVGNETRLDIIADLLREKKVLSVKALRRLFPEVTSRTLRRDMDKLEKLGIAKQKGHTKDTTYILA
jgi:predicted HTH transcriptional regulator